MISPSSLWRDRGRLFALLPVLPLTYKAAILGTQQSRRECANFTEMGKLRGL